MIKIDYDKCIKCGYCKEACITGSIKMDKNIPKIQDDCIYCGNCIAACPAGAIRMAVKEKEDIKGYSGVWVIIENDSNTNMPKNVSYELLSQARRLADQLKEEVYAVQISKKSEEKFYKDIENIWCNHLLLVEDDFFEEYDTSVFSEIITKLIRKYKPSVVLLPGTENGRDLAPRISARLGVGLTADCTDLKINEKNELVQIRPTYGGNILASIITPDHRPQMATIRPNVFRVSQCKKKYKLKITRIENDIYSNIFKVKRIGFTQKKNMYRDVTEADIVLIAGYGVKKDDFKLIYKLADKLDAAVGVTRKVVDEGLAPMDIQIGQTGKVIAPEVCICFGVSGSLQHTIGIKGSKKIIAVNSDPTAQIFGMSDQAILADCGQVIRHMLEMV